jgi:hypothetical protein
LLPIDKHTHTQQQQQSRACIHYSSFVGPDDDDDDDRTHMAAANIYVRMNFSIMCALAGRCRYYITKVKRETLSHFEPFFIISILREPGLLMKIASEAPLSKMPTSFRPAMALTIFPLTVKTLLPMRCGERVCVCAEEARSQWRV